jgi:hypothetical protein
MDCSLDHLSHIGHARQIGCRWPKTTVYSYLNRLPIFVTLEVGYILLTNNIFCVWYFDFNLVTSALMEYDTFETNTIRCLITNAIFHAYRIRWFLEQFWVIMSTGMGCIFKYRIQIISNSTEIGTASPKITQQNLYFPLSALRSHT